MQVLQQVTEVAAQCSMALVPVRRVFCQKTFNNANRQQR
jgi:hypothetical protein